MNGHGIQKVPTGSDASPQSADGPLYSSPAAKILIETYTNDLLPAAETREPRYNPMNPSRPQSSAIVDLQDPIQVHLLAETALSDSKAYEILSPEEVDGLKKQIQYLSQRVEQTKANLAIQAKYRDAAISMAKLYAPSGVKRRSLLGNRLSVGDSAREAHAEKQASERRCEELAAELFSLEKRLMVPQRRLLQHTAGILQMTHRAPAQHRARHTADADVRTRGMPGSPESLYTYSNGRNSLEPAADGFSFDDSSLYFPLHGLDAQQHARNAIQIPMKSPGREQQTQLREETDRLRQENARLLAEVEDLRNFGSDRVAVLTDVERKMEDLNANTRRLVINFNPSRYSNFPTPPTAYAKGRSSGLEPGDLIASQLSYLEKGLAAAAEEQRTVVSDAASREASMRQAESIMQTLNQQVSEMLHARDPDYPAPPDPTASTVANQLVYLRDAVTVLQTEIPRAAELSSSSAADREKSDQMETALTGLWDTIQSGYADIKQRKAERRRMRVEKGLEPDADESADEAIDLDEPYSLQAFSAKIQWLYSQATRLKEQKSVLKTQIKQQRELNNKSTSDKDRELAQVTTELQTARKMLDSVEEEAKEAQDKLSKALKDLDTMQQTSANNESASYEEARQQLMERDNIIAELQANGEELRKELSRVEDNVTLVGGQLEDALRAKNLAESRAEELQKQVRDKDEELERMNGMIIELKTEATIAKAELEGAYGSRAQRAAEAAKVTQNAELTELTAQNQKLRKELEETLSQLEIITKETIAATKERMEMEGQLDDAMAAKTNLEGEIDKLRGRLNNEVARLQEQLDAEKLKVPPSPGGPGAVQSRAGAAMLSEQFRATMKEERKKFQEEMKDEQAKRRKLEDELRALRRAQGPGRSPLGPLSPRS